MTEVRSYRDLRIWSEGMDLAVKAHELTREFPREELYGLTSQIRRSAGSVPANIAEGFGRNSTGSYVHYLRIARGSLNELETHLYLSARMKVTSEQKVEPLIRHSEVLGRMISSTIRSIESSKETAR